MAEVMKAVSYSKYKGGASALEHVEVPVPIPKKGQVLMKIEVSSVNPVDWKIQNGDLRPMFPYRLPTIPGSDVAGEVVKLGPGVTDFQVGQKVVTHLDIGSGGALAEYAVAYAKVTAARPPEVSAEVGACLVIAGITALQSVRDSNGAGAKLDGTYKGNILVTGASGGVGIYAVQLAKLSGAHVTATAGSRNIQLIKELGADEVLDYKTPEGASLQSPSGKKYDAIIHGAKETPWSTFESVLQPNGKVVDLSPTSKGFARALKQTLFFSKRKLSPFIMRSSAPDLQLLLDLTVQGKLKTIIDSKFPLSEAEKAWERSIEGHATGKIVVDVM